LSALKKSQSDFILGMTFPMMTNASAISQLLTNPLSVCWIAGLAIPVTVKSVKPSIHFYHQWRFRQDQNPKRRTL